MPSRIGLGFDSHKLAPGAGLKLGGIEIPCDFHAVGHSDADVLLHALVDAILGAAARGDIGDHFPDTDMQWKGANSRVFVEKAVAVAREAGMAVGNVDCTVFLEKPKLGPLKRAIEKNIAAMLGVSEKNVSVKAKTRESLGGVGRGEEIAAQVGIMLHTAQEEKA